MIRVAYLASQDTLPGPERRTDAFEYDRMRAALDGPFRASGLELVGVCWDAEHDWSSFDAALIGTTWDYWEKHARFLEVLTDIEAAIPLFNPVDTVRWNSDKAYLRQLPTPPTLFGAGLDAAFMERCFAELGEDVVVKRRVGAGAYGQQRIHRGEPWEAIHAPVIAQAFLPSIQSEGEISVIVVDGEVSHAVRKRPAAGDYRIQSMYGGWNSPHVPTEAERELALGVMPEGLLYGRVDLVRWSEEPAVMELELIEPYLYPDEGPELGRRLAQAIRRRL